MAQAEGLPALKLGGEAVAAAGNSIREIRDEMKGAAIDKADAAGAIMRSEIRSWLRGLDPAKLTAKINTPDLDPTVALAIVEAPPELSGVLPEAREKLTERSLAALHPDKGGPDCQDRASHRGRGQCRSCRFPGDSELDGLDRTRD